MKRLGFLMCMILVGCGDPHITGDVANVDSIEDPGSDDAGSGDDSSGNDGAVGSDSSVGPDSKTGVYLFDCDTIAGGIEDLPIEMSVDPSDQFASGVANEVTLEGSITLDQDTVAGILSRGVELVDVNQSVITVLVSGATPPEVDVPGPTISGFDLTVDTDSDGIAGPHTFAVGPVDAEITPSGGGSVSFDIDIESLQLSLGNVPIIGSLDIPDFCRERALDGEPITFSGSGEGGAGGAGGAGGQGGVGGASGAGGDGTSPCDRDRLFDDGDIFDGELRNRICRWRRAIRGR